MARKTTYAAARRSLAEARKALDQPVTPRHDLDPPYPTPAEVKAEVARMQEVVKKSKARKPAPGSKAVAMHGESHDDRKSLLGWGSGFIGARTRPRYLAQGTLGTIGEAQPGDLVIMGGVLTSSRIVEIAWITASSGKDTKKRIVEGAFVHLGRPGEWRRPYQGPEDLRWMSAHVHVRFLGLKPAQRS
jgi:hypothetical protein